MRTPGFTLAWRSMHDEASSFNALTDSQFRLASYILARVNWEPNEVTLPNGKKLTLQRGEMLTSYQALTRLPDGESNTRHRSWARRAIDKLEKVVFLIHRSVQYGTVLKVVNYGKYQDIKTSSDTLPDIDPDTPPGHPPGLPPDTPPGHRELIINNINTFTKNTSDTASADADKPPGKRKFKFNDEQEALAEWIFGLVKTVMPSAKPPNLANWANEVRLMLELDKRTETEVRELFTLANAHQFWGANILSPQKLRKHWNQLTLQSQKASQQPKKKDPLAEMFDQNRVYAGGEVTWD